MNDKISLSGQAAAVRLLLDRGVIAAMRRSLRESEAELMRARLVAAAETLEMLAPHEAKIRAAYLKALGEV